MQGSKGGSSNVECFARVSVIENVTFLKGEEFQVSIGDVVIDEQGRFASFHESHQAVKLLRDQNRTIDNVIDGTGHLMIPGLIDAHCHVLDSLQKELWVGHTIKELFAPNGIKAAAIARATDQDLRDSAAMAYAQMVQLGVTSACVFVEDGLRGLRAASGHANTPNLVLLGRPSPGHVSQAEAVSMIGACEGFAPGSVSGHTVEEMETMAQQAHKVGKFTATHIAEYEPTQNFDKCLEHFQPRFLVHCNYLTTEQLSTMGQRKVGVVCCIRSGSTFGMRMCDISTVVKSGITFALGTDNVMSNAPDMLRELEYVSRHLCAHSGGVLPVSAERMLRSVTVDAARLLNMPDRGLIQSGYHADAVLLNMGPALQPFKGAMSVIFRAGAQDIRAVLIGGRVRHCPRPETVGLKHAIESAFIRS